VTEAVFVPIMCSPLRTSAHVPSTIESVETSVDPKSAYRIRLRSCWYAGSSTRAPACNWTPRPRSRTFCTSGLSSPTIATASRFGPLSCLVLIELEVVAVTRAIGPAAACDGGATNKAAPLMASGIPPRKRAREIPGVTSLESAMRPSWRMRPTALRMFHELRGPINVASRRARAFPTHARGGCALGSRSVGAHGASGPNEACRSLATSGCVRLRTLRRGPHISMVCFAMRLQVPQLASKARIIVVGRLSRSPPRVNLSAGSFSIMDSWWSAARSPCPLWRCFAWMSAGPSTLRNRVTPHGLAFTRGRAGWAGSQARLSRRTARRAAGGWSCAPARARIR